MNNPVGATKYMDDPLNPRDLPSIEGIDIPAQIKMNAISALAAGVGNLITSAIDIPTALLEGVSNDIRAKAAGRAAVIRTVAELACADVRADPALRERAAAYFSNRMIGEQRNRENVAHRFRRNLLHLPPGEDASGRIDDDWLNVFWRIAETKSNEEIQEFLARLLSKEARIPGSVSPHTLQLLTIITADLGRKLRRLACLSISDDSSTYVIHPHVFAFQSIGPLDQYGVQYDDLFDLDGAKLIRSAEAITLNYAAKPDGKLEPVDFGGSPAMIRLDGLQVRLIQFTVAGREIRNLMELERNPAYVEALGEKLKDRLVI